MRCRTRRQSPEAAVAPFNADISIPAEDIVGEVRAVIIRFARQANQLSTCLTTTANCLTNTTAKTTHDQRN